MMCRSCAAWVVGGLSVGATLIGCNFLVGVGDYAVGDDGGVGGDGGAESSDATHGDVVQPDVRAQDVSNANASDARATYSDASYSDASYSDASYSDASYSDASYSDASYSDASYSDASYSDVSYSDASYSDASFPDVRTADAAIVADAAYSDIVFVDVGAAREAAVDAQSSDGASNGDSSVACGSTLPGASDSAFQQLVKACTLAVSCDPQYFDVNISECISGNLFGTSSFYNCLPQIATCADFFACWGVITPSNSNIMAADNVGGAVCSGQLAINGDYSGLPDLEYDCTVLGGACRVFTDPEGYPAARCVVGTGKCSDADYTVSCVGTSSYECLGGVSYGKDCSKFGGTCVKGTSGTGCLPAGGTCVTAPGTSTCNGATLDLCSTSGVSYPYDCSVANEVCASGANSCISPGCSPSASNADQCNVNSGKITVSIGGAPYEIDCTKIDTVDGFTSCTTSTQTSSGLVYAWCQ